MSENPCSLNLSKSERREANVETVCDLVVTAHFYTAIPQIAFFRAANQDIECQTGFSVSSLANDNSKGLQGL